MNQIPERVFMFFGEAVSGTEESGFPVGERHRVAGFGRGREINFAAELAAEHFLDAGWTDVSFDGGEELNRERLASADSNIVETYEECERDGSSGIVFSTVVEDG